MTRLAQASAASHTTSQCQAKEQLITSELPKVNKPRERPAKQHSPEETRQAGASGAVLQSSQAGNQIKRSSNSRDEGKHESTAPKKSRKDTSKGKKMEAQDWMLKSNHASYVPLRLVRLQAGSGYNFICRAVVIKRAHKSNGGGEAIVLKRSCLCTDFLAKPRLVSQSRAFRLDVIQRTQRH